MSGFESQSIRIWLDLYCKMIRVQIIQIVLDLCCNLKHIFISRIWLNLFWNLKCALFIKLWLDLRTQGRGFELQLDQHLPVIFWWLKLILNCSTNPDKSWWTNHVLNWTTNPAKFWWWTYLTVLYMSNRVCCNSSHFQMVKTDFKLQHKSRQILLIKMKK